MSENEYSYDFFGLGEALVELISSNPANSLAEANEFHRAVGGQVAGLAASMARCGNRVGLATCVGMDGFGQFLQTELTKAGIHTEFIQTTPDAPTTIKVISSSARGSAFIIHRGADTQLRYNFQLDDALAQSQYIHTSAFALARDPSRATILNALHVCCQRGQKVTFDPNYHPKLWPDTSEYWQIVKQTCAIAYLVKPSLEDCERLSQPGLPSIEYVEIFLQWGAKNVVLTMGDQGTLIATAKGLRAQILPHQPIAKHETVVDEAFWSGLLTALIKGHALSEAACFGQANVEAKINSTRHGVPPDWRDLEKRAANIEITTQTPES